MSSVPITRLYVSSLGEIEFNGVDCDTEKGLPEEARRFVRFVWSVQDKLADGRFNIRGIWPNVYLDTEFFRPHGHKAAIKAAEVAEQAGLFIEIMKSPEPRKCYICMSTVFHVYADFDSEDYARTRKAMVKRKLFIRNATQDYWNAHGLAVT